MPATRKLLVANRGEIAVCAFRSATEFGIKTVAVYPYEDSRSEHRLIADEAAEIGDCRHPVQAYLDPSVIVVVTLHANADAIYSVDRFLSENPALAEACARAALAFVWPPQAVLELTGSKTRPVAAARQARLLAPPDLDRRQRHRPCRWRRTDTHHTHPLAKEIRTVSERPEPSLRSTSWRLKPTPTSYV